MALLNLYDAVKHLPVLFWNIAACLTGCVFAYAVTVTWDDDAQDIIVRSAAVVLGFLFVYSVHRGVGWGCIGQIIGSIWHAVSRFWNWLNRGPAVERIILGLIPVGFCLFVKLDWESAVKPNVKKMTSLYRLKVCSYALIQYAQDYDDQLPPDIRRKTVSHYLKPYHTQSEYFIDPISNEPFVWRRYISGINTASISNPADVVTIYSPKPQVRGNRSFRSTAFLDGRAEFITEDIFQASLLVVPKHTPKPRSKP